MGGENTRGAVSLRDCRPTREVLSFAHTEGDQQIMEYTATDHGEVVIFKLKGYLKGQPEGYAFLDVVRKKIQDGSTKMIVDLGDLERIDSSGIGVIASIVTSAQNSGCSLCFARLEGKVRQLLEMVGLTRIIECHECGDDALRKLNES